MLHIAGERLEEDPVPQGNALVQRNLTRIRDELIDLRGVSLTLHAEAVREELAEAQLNEEQALLDFLRDGDRCLDLPVAEFRQRVQDLRDFVELIDPKRKTWASREWERAIEAMVALRQTHDHEVQSTHDIHATAASRISQLEEEKKFHERIAPLMVVGQIHAPAYTAFSHTTLHLEEDVKRSLFVATRTALLRDIANIEFCFVPAGMHSVGTPAAEHPGCLFPSGDQDTFHTPAGRRKMDGYFISKRPVQVKQLLQLSSAVLHFPKLQDALEGFSAKEVLSVRTPPPDFIRDTGDPESLSKAKEFTGGFMRCGHCYETHEKAAPDGVAEIHFFQAQAIAESLGCTLPTWQQWEVAQRGDEGYLYPWGNEADDREIYLKVGRLVSFGKYGASTSPFGLENLARAGCEWNKVTQGDFSPELNRVYATKDDPPVTHCLRSLADYVGCSAEVPLGKFTGPSLPTYGKPNQGVARAAFRLVLGLGVSAHAVPVHDSVECLIPLLGGAQWSALSVLGRVEEMVESGSGCVMCYFTQGVAVHCEEGVVVRVTLHTGPTRDRDFAACPLLIEVSEDPRCASATLQSLDPDGPLPVSLTRSCNAELIRVPRDAGVPCGRQTVTLVLSPL